MSKKDEKITVGDLLAQFDEAILYLLERRYLDDWHHKFNDFQSSPSNLDWQNSFCGFKVEGIRYFREGNQELALQNMENFLGHYRDGSHSLICSIDGRRGKPPELCFMSTRCHNYKDTIHSRKSSQLSTSEYDSLMNRGFKANFPGAQLQSTSVHDYSELAIWSEEASHVGILTGVPARKQHNEEFFAQGIERFLDSVSGLDFTCLLVAEPYTVEKIKGFLYPALKLKSEIAQLQKATLTESWSEAKSKALTTTLGANMGVGSSDSTTRLGGGAALGPLLSTLGVILGGVMTGAQHGAPGGPAGMAIGASIGAVIAAGIAISNGIPISHSHSDSTNMGGFASFSGSISTSRTQGQSVSREVINATATHALEIVDEYIERLRDARAYGLWNVGFYCFSNKSVDYVGVKNAATSVFSGERSGMEPLRFVDLKFGNIVEEVRPEEERESANEGRADAIKGIVAGFHPRLQGNGFTDHPLGVCFAGLSTPLNTRELAIVTAPPQRECRSISVTERGSFGGALPKSSSQRNKGARLLLGIPEYFGAPQNTPLSVPMASLVRHAFVTGITGSGKTNTIQYWCEQLSSAGVPWMVIEPTAKREYRNLVCDAVSGPAVYSLGNEGVGTDAAIIPMGAPFRLNPFYFERGIALLTHLDALKACFNAAFPMYASMPYILEEAMAGVYEVRGWRLTDSSNRFSDDPWSDRDRRYLFPTLRELHDSIDGVVKGKRYDQRLQMDISAALRARIGSLLLGSKGAMLDTPVSISMNKLTGRDVVLELGSMGSDDEKVFVMGLLILALCEHATTKGLTGGEELRHVLVVEEAHRLLRNAAPSDNPEIANTRGAAIEQFANMLAEMRGFGQGIVVVDQVPSRLLPDVLKNTNLKVIHQLCAADDRKSVGDSIVLSSRQRDELARLEPRRGQAVVYQQQWEQPYCMRVPKQPANKSDPAVLRQVRDALIRKNPDIYGRKGKFVGVSRQDWLDNYKVDIARLRIGMAANAPKIFRKGMEPFMARLSTLPLTWVLDEYLLDTMRISSARLSLLTECPELFQRLAAEVIYGKSTFEQTLCKLNDVLMLAVIEDDDGESKLIGAALNEYVSRSDMGRIPESIARTKEAGDASYKAFKEHLEVHLAKICDDDVDPSIRLVIEVQMLEQTLRLSGFFNSHEIVEGYRSRFL